MFQGLQYSHLQKLQRNSLLNRIQYVEELGVLSGTLKFLLFSMFPNKSGKTIIVSSTFWRSWWFCC